DQSPGEGQRARRRTAAPARPWILERDALDCLADQRGFLVRAPDDLAPGFELEPVLHPPCDMLGMAGDMDLAVGQPDDAARRRPVADSMRLPEERDHAPGRE